MKENTALRFTVDLVRIYLRKHVSRSAAELSYFLTLSVFPTLMCLYALVWKIIPTQDILEGLLTGVVPTETLDAISDYLIYVSEYSSGGMFFGGAMLMATSSAAAFRALHNIMADIQGAPKHRGAWFVVKSFLLSLVFLLVMYFTVIVIVTGEWFLNMVAQYMPVQWDWSWLRFVLLFAILLMMVLGVYRLTAPRHHRHNILAGAICAAAAMVLVGMGFSAMMSVSVRYSLVYGSLASIIILMLWLYFFGNILIMGNVVNVLLAKYRRA